MGAGASGDAGQAHPSKASPRRSSSRRRRVSSARKHSRSRERSERMPKGVVSKEDPPPQPAVAAARSRGDYVYFAEAALTLCLCKRRRLELLEGADAGTALRWLGTIDSMEVVAVDGDVVLRCGGGGETLAVISQRDLALVRVLASLQRLATRAAIAHSLWRGVEEAGVVKGGAEIAATHCLDCGELLRRAPPFCPSSGRPHPQGANSGEDWEAALRLASYVDAPTPRQDRAQSPSGEPSAADLEEAVAKGEVVEYVVEGGSTHRLVLVYPERLEKFVDGKWDRPVSTLEVPHVGSRALRDHHRGVTGGCMLQQPTLVDTLRRIATLADRALVPHNLWDHTSRAAPQGFGTRTQSTDREQVHRQASALSTVVQQGPDRPLRYRRRLSGPSDAQATPASVPVRSPGLPPGAISPVLPPGQRPSDDEEQINPEITNVSMVGSEFALPAAVEQIATTQSIDIGNLANLEHPKEGQPIHGTTHTIAEECCVCLEEQKNTVLMPCRHLCVCSECAQVLSVCPLCRFDVVHRLEVWL